MEKRNNEVIYLKINLNLTKLLGFSSVYLQKVMGICQFLTRALWYLSMLDTLLALMCDTCPSHCYKLSHTYICIYLCVIVFIKSVLFKPDRIIEWVRCQTNCISVYPFKSLRKESRLHVITKFSTLTLKIIQRFEELLDNSGTFTVFNDEPNFWLNWYANKQNWRIWRKTNQLQILQTS